MPAVAVLLSLLLAPLARAEDKLKIGVLDFTSGPGVGAELAGAVSGGVAHELDRLNTF